MEWFTGLLTGFFALFRLSNLAPHSLSYFHPSRHLTGHDVFFYKIIAKLFIKWSKNIQSRGTVQCITLPKLQDSSICLFTALKALFQLYPMSAHFKGSKNAKSHQSKIGFPSEDFRRGGATFAFNAQIPIHAIKRHGTWSSNCVWKYIQSDHSSG